MFEKQNILTYGIILAIAFIGSAILAINYYPDWQYSKTVAAIKAQLKEKDTLGTLALLESAYADYPDDTYIEEHYFELLYEKNLEKVYLLLEQKLKQGSLSQNLKQLWVQVLIDKNQLKEAVDAAHALLEAKSSDGSNLKLAGKTAYNIGDYASAITLLNAALEIAPQDIEIRLYRARIHALGKNLDLQIRAKSEFLEIAQIKSPYQGEALLTLARSDQLLLFPDDLALVMKTLASVPDFLSIVNALPYVESKRIVERMGTFNLMAAYQLSRDLIQKTEASTEDKVYFVQLAQNNQQPEAALPILEALIQADPNNLSLLNLRARNLFLSQDIAACIEQIDDVLKIDKANEAILSSLVSLLALSQEGSSVQSAWIATRILEHPKARFDDILSAYQWQLKHIKEKRAKVLDSAIARLQADHLVELTFWLNQNGAFERVLEVIDKEEAQSSELLSVNRSEALLRLERYAELDAWLIANYVPVLQKEYFLCRRYLQEGKIEKAKVHWGLATEEAVQIGSHQLMLQLARISHWFKDIDMSIKAFRIAHMHQAAFTEFDWLVYFNYLIQAELYYEALKTANQAVNKYPKIVSFSE